MLNLSNFFIWLHTPANFWCNNVNDVLKIQSKFVRFRDIVTLLAHFCYLQSISSHGDLRLLGYIALLLCPMAHSAPGNASIIFPLSLALVLLTACRTLGQDPPTRPPYPTTRLSPCWLDLRVIIVTLWTRTFEVTKRSLNWPNQWK
jgi:hypothetical protein